MVDPGIIQYDQGQRHPLLALGDTVNQHSNGIAFDRLPMQVIPELAGGIVQGTDNVHALSCDTGIRHMGLAFRVPSSLHIGDIEKTALVQAKQAHNPFDVPFYERFPKRLLWLAPAQTDGTRTGR
jgi:hypothetical protein